MADQGSSSSSFSYDVFISFLGQDTSTGFGSNLCAELTANRIHTFIADDEISKGNEINLELVKVIQESRIAIIVFSENYVFSSFCLDVLAYIVDNFQQNNNLKPYRLILPVYVDISPSDVQNQTELYSEAFAKHEYKLKEDKNKLYKWRSALSHVANLSAWNFKHGGGFNEFKIINNIVEHVSRNFDRVALQSAILDVVPEDSQTSPQRVHSLYVKTEMATWRVVGLMSSLIGLSCYTLSPSFDRLTGRREPFKVFLYIVLSLAISTTILFANQLSLSLNTGIGQLKKTCTIFAVVIIISVYSFIYDKAVDGKPDILSVVSNAAFALVSLSLHKLLKFKSEIGVFSYFLGCFTIQLLTINWMLIFVAIIYGCLLSIIHSQGVSQTVQVMMSISLRVFQTEMAWKVVGFMSYVVSFLNCKPFNAFLSVVLSLAILTIILFAKQSSSSTRHVLKTYTSFAASIIISVHSLFYDEAMNGKPETQSIVSIVAFALVSLSLHKLIDFGFEIGVFYYFIGHFTIQLLHINWMLIFVIIIFGGPLLVNPVRRFLWMG